MIDARVGEAVLLEAMASDRATGLYPQAVVVDDSGAVVATVNLTAATGLTSLYVGEWTPSVVGYYSVVTNLYTDSGRTTLAGYAPTVEKAVVRLHPLDEPMQSHLTAGSLGEAVFAAFGDAGGNVRDDALTYDSNDRPLTLRRRIFASAAAAAASTPGGTGEGELVTITIAATHASATEWTTLLRRRTA